MTTNTILEAFEKDWISKDLCDIYISKKIENLSEIQMQGLEYLAQNKSHFKVVINSPTGSGKTLIAEVAAYNQLIRREKNRVAYLVPYKALATQKSDDFHSLFNDSLNLGLNINEITGDEIISPQEALNLDLAIFTYEMFDYYQRNYSSFIDNLGLVIIDELDFIGEEERGFILEISLTRLKINHSQISLLGISATISNSDDIQAWLGCDLLVSEQRLLPLIDIIYNLSDCSTTFRDEEEIELELPKTLDPRILESLLVELLEKYNQPILVFCSTRKDVESLSSSLSVKLKTKKFENTFSKTEDELADIFPFKPSRRIARIMKKCLSSRTAFHHAGLGKLQRKYIEKEYSSGNIVVMFSTTSLSTGLNLPARFVIFNDMKKGKKTLSISDYIRISGRAGRPGYVDESGVSIMIANRSIDVRRNADYWNRLPESVISTIPNQSLNILLSLISDSLSFPEIVSFYKETLWGKTEDEVIIEQKLTSDLTALERSKLVEKKEDSYYILPLGEAVGKELLEVPTVIEMINVLSTLDTNKTNWKLFSLAKILGTSTFDWGNQRPRIYRLKIVPNLGKLFSDFDENERHGFLNDKMVSSLAAAMYILQYAKGVPEEEIEASIYQDIESGRYAFWSITEMIQNTVPKLSFTLRSFIRIAKSALEDRIEASLIEELEKLSRSIYSGVPYNCISLSVLQRNPVIDREVLLQIIKTGYTSIESLIDSGPEKLREKTNQYVSDLIWRTLPFVTKKQDRDYIKAIYLADTKGMDIKPIRQLITETGKSFEKAVVEIFKVLHSIKILDDISFPKKHEGDPNPECISSISVKDSEYTIAIECKSKEDLKNKVIGQSKIREADTKFPERNEFKRLVVIGTPDFDETAISYAEERDICLINVDTFISIVVQILEENIDPEMLVTLFQKSGKINFSSENVE